MSRTGKLWRGVLGLAAATLGCASGLTRDDVQTLDGRATVLVIVEPSAIPRFEPGWELRPEDLLDRARALADRSVPPPEPVEKRIILPALDGLTDASGVLADHLAGRFSKQRLLRPPPAGCVLHGAAPDVPSECAQLPVELRIQVRVIQFAAWPDELRLRTFVARSSLVDRTSRRTLWSSQCELLPVELPNVPGAMTTGEINQILERAAQVCADKLELDLRESLRRAR